jgi:hypothetical protein
MKESDPKVRGTGPGILIRTKMSWIPNTGKNTAVLHGQENFLFGHAAHQVVIG